MKKFNDLVNAQLTRRIKNHDQLSSSVYKLLHLNKEKHNIWVITKQQQLTVLTDNPYLATQINYQLQNICNELNRKFLLNLKTMKVKIVPLIGTKEVTREERFLITEETAKILKDIAKDINDDELRQSLLQLTHRKKN
jgi:hypothetical protein